MTDNNNRDKFPIGGDEVEVEASLGAMQLYAQEFRDKTEPPYPGDLLNDIVIESQQLALQGVQFYTWDIAPKALGAAWAMARAAGSTDEPWDVFRDRVQQVVTSYEPMIFALSVLDGPFGRRTFFRGSQGRLNDLLSDKA